MDADYWDIDNIFSQTQKLDCQFPIEVPNLGHIDGGEEESIAVDTKMQLPYWLAAPLLANQLVKCPIPPPFNLQVRKALNAEPRSVKLSQLVGTGGSWYGFGTQFSELLEEQQSNDLAEVMHKTFNARLADLIDQAQNFTTSIGSTSGAAHEFREGMDATERELFTLVQQSTSHKRSWEESTEKR